MNWKALRKTVLAFLIPITLMSWLYYSATTVGIISKIMGYALIVLLAAGMFGCVYLYYDDQEKSE